MSMTRMNCFVLFLAGTLLCQSGVATAKKKGKESSAEDECRLWLGLSHLGTEDDPELGMFAGKDFEENDIIPDVELAIPLVDFTDAYDKSMELDKAIVEFVESQVWTGDYAGAKWEGDHSTIVAVAGIGNLANYHSGTHNVDWLQSAAILRKKDKLPEAGVAHPSRGAITPYHDLTMRATRKIPMGMEMFANFGETWDANLTDNAFQDKLTRWDYVHADQVVDAIVKFMEEYDEDLTPDLKEDIMDFMLDKILGTATGKQAKIIRSLIPANPRKLKDVQEAGGTFMYRNNDLVKSESWLKKHAICMDNLRGGPSTIPEAGRGAFATRKIAKGKIIAPSPMLHIANHELLSMYEIVDGEEDEDGEPTLTYDREKPIGQQLLLNYCFGHRESSMLLFPIGSKVTLINHASKGKANAYITWSRHKHVTNDHSLHDLTIQDMAERKSVGIVMVVQAMRNIKEGEEIFIDYGPEWEAAWEQYTTTWKATFGKDKTWELKADDMKIQYESIPFVANLKEGASPYPPGVATTCLLKTMEPEDGTPRKSADDREILAYSDSFHPANATGTDMYVCDVIARSDKLKDGNLYNYTVVAKISDDEIVQVINVPHSSITFVDQPYKGDIHMRGAFRHAISVRDSDWPQNWRNLREFSGAEN